MTIRAAQSRFPPAEDIHFILTNYIPRRLLTQFMGWFSQIEQPLVRDLSLAIWRRFADLELEDALKTRFDSLHDCFIRELKPGARPIDPDPSIVVSPCDAIVGACGAIRGTTLIQAKDSTYTLDELLDDPELSRLYADGSYVTLRLTASMYHRFHAPHDLSIEAVRYFAGDTWNTHPTALARVQRLFCKNERAVLRTRLSSSRTVITLVPVAAILVASIRLHCLDVLLHLEYGGAERVQCDAHYAKGDELGWFQHGSTILVFAPAGVELCPNVLPGVTIRQGQGLFRLP